MIQIEDHDRRRSPATSCFCFIYVILTTFASLPDFAVHHLQWLAVKVVCHSGRAGCCRGLGSDGGRSSPSLLLIPPLGASCQPWPHFWWQLGHLGPMHTPASRMSSMRLSYEILKSTLHWINSQIRSLSQQSTKNQSTRQPLHHRSSRRRVADICIANILSTYMVVVVKQNAIFKNIVYMI